MLEASALTKRYGDKLAVDDLSLRVRPGQVTGFLGPNGAGKSTTMRLMLGLDGGGGRTILGRPGDQWWAWGGTGADAGSVFFEKKETPRAVKRRAENIRGSSEFDQPNPISLPNIPLMPSLPPVPIPIPR